MRINGTLILVSILLIPGSVMAQREGARPKSVSRSKQFVVYGEEARVRGAFCQFAEDVKEEFLRLLRQKDRWDHPVVIQIRKGLAPAGMSGNFRWLIYEIEGGWSLQLFVWLNERFSKDLLAEEILQLLIAEQILRREGSFEERAGRPVLPHWLVEGIGETLRHRRAGRPSDIFSSVFHSNLGLSAAEILEMNPAGADSVTRTVFRASAAALVQALLEQPSGEARFAAFLENLQLYADDVMPLLMKHFPAFSHSRYGLDKWWSLQLATLARPGVLELLDAMETERRLAEALLISYTVESGKSGGKPERVVCSPKAYPQFMGFKKGRRREILAPGRLRLMELSYRAFPLYKPIVDGYAGLLQDLAEGKKRDAGRRLEQLEADRRGVLALAGQVEDYLNWYEATKSEAKSGAFEAYSKAMREMRAGRRQRKDPISLYLDRMEKELEVP